MGKEATSCWHLMEWRLCPTVFHSQTNLDVTLRSSYRSTAKYVHKTRYLTQQYHSLCQSQTPPSYHYQQHHHTFQGSHLHLYLCFGTENRWVIYNIIFILVNWHGLSQTFCNYLIRMY